MKKAGIYSGLEGFPTWDKGLSGHHAAKETACAVSFVRMAAPDMAAFSIRIAAPDIAAFFARIAAPDIAAF